MSDLDDVVDEFADELDPDRLDREAERLGVTVDVLLSRIVAEVKARIG